MDTIILTLRDYQTSDIDRLVTLANNKRVSQYLVDTFPFPYSKADAEFWVSEGASAHGNINKVILLDDVFVGSVGIKPQQGWKSHCAEIGYWLAEEYWGQGIATEALKMMTRNAFNDHGVQKLFATVLAPNCASMRVLEKAGYTQEGLLRRDVIKNGQYYDVHHYAKLASP